jgi:hypothetical protein
MLNASIVYGGGWEVSGTLLAPAGDNWTSLAGAQRTRGACRACTTRLR